MSKQKAKGTAAETAVVNYLKWWFPWVERRTLSGTNDKGDINIHKDVVIEVKDHQRMALSEWVDEAKTEGANAGSWLRVVWHKRARKGSPADWYVTMDGCTFATILAQYFELLALESSSEQLAKLMLEGLDAGKSTKS